MSDDNPDVPTSSSAFHSVAIASTIAAALLQGASLEAQHPACDNANDKHRGPGPDGKEHFVK